MVLPKVTIVGAGQVGATAAFLLALKGITDVTLIDVVEGIPQGKALDMMHARSIEKFASRVRGTNDYADTAGSDIVVVTAGLPRKPGMTREDLLAANAAIVRSVVEQVRVTSPAAVLIIVTNPLDAMVELAWRVFAAPPARVIGMGGVLDSARFAYFIAEATGASITDVDALVIGAHGDTMVPLPRFSTVSGRPVTEILSESEIAEVVRRTIHGGAEVVSLLKSGSAFYAPAASVVSMVSAIAHDTGRVMSSCVRLSGEYGLSDLYLNVPAQLSAEGVRAVRILDLNDEEIEALHASAAGVAESILSLNVAD